MNYLRGNDRIAYMSGHSKWATIHRDKEINDQKRGQAFTKVANAITLAVKEAGGISDPNTNFKLRLAIEKARSINMPNDKITKAVERGLGRGGGEELTDTTFEGYTSDGIGVLVETLSDNHQRTVQEIKNIFDRAGGSIVSPGSVAFNFKKVGVIEISIGTANRDELILKLIDLGVDDVEEEDSQKLIAYVPVNRLEEFKLVIAGFGLEVLSSEIIQKPVNAIKITDNKVAKQLISFVGKLDTLDDVQRVYINATLPKESLSL